ncbi:hypothetical protein CROQUDRAFT_659389, partial [Cronartium quercuum f. sp. fusiforme G11]
MANTVAGLSVPSADLCHVQWRSLAWVLENGPINEKNAMEYFSHSPFYDRRSTNQVLRMQSMFSGQPPLDPEAEKEALRKLVGVEYTLVLSKPEADREGGLFVIEKRDRKGPDESYPMASYYILKTCIYQSPSFHATLSCRLLTSLSSLYDLLALARSHKPLYDPRQGYAWKIKAQDDGPEDESVVAQTEELKTNGEAEKSPSRSNDEPNQVVHQSMEIDEETIPESKTDHQSTGPELPLNPDSIEMRNMLLERAFQATAAIFSLPKPTPNVKTQHALTSAESIEESETQEHQMINSSNNLGVATTNSIKDLAQITPSLSLIPLSGDGHHSDPNSPSGRSNSKGITSGKRKLK